MNEILYGTEFATLGFVKSHGTRFVPQKNERDVLVKFVTGCRNNEIRYSVNGICNS